MPLQLSLTTIPNMYIVIAIYTLFFLGPTALLARLKGKFEDSDAASNGTSLAYIFVFLYTGLTLWFHLGYGRELSVPPLELPQILIYSLFAGFATIALFFLIAAGKHFLKHLYKDLKSLTKL